MAAELPLVIRGRDRTKAAFKSVDSNVAKLGRGLRTSLGGGIAAAGGLLFAIDKLVDRTAQLGRDASEFGLGVEQFQALRIAAVETGTEVQRLGDFYKDFREKLGEAQNEGTGELQSAFELLGLDPNAFDNAETAMSAFLNRIEGLSEESQRALQGMVAGIGADLTVAQLRAIEASFDDVSGSIDGLPDVRFLTEEEVAKATKIATETEKIKTSFVNSVTSGFLEQIGEVDSEEYKEIAVQLAQWGVALGTAVGHLSDILGFIVDIPDKIAAAFETETGGDPLVALQEKAIEDFIQKNSKLSRQSGFLIRETLSQARERILAAGGDLKNTLETLDRNLEDAKTNLARTSANRATRDAAAAAAADEPVDVEKIVEPVKEVIRITSEEFKKLVALGDPVGEAIRQYNADLKIAGENTDAIAGATQKYTETMERLGEEALRPVREEEEKRLELEMERLDLLKEEQEELVKLAASQQSLIDRYDTEGAARRMLAEDIAELENFARAETEALGVATMETTVALAAAREQLIALGEDSSIFATLGDDILTKLSDQLASGNFENIGDALTDIIGSTVIDALKDPEKRKELFDAASELLSGILDAFKGEGEGGGLLGSLGGFFGSLFGGGKADGGDVSAGRIYRVGERGPELFAPGQNGFIIPNNALGGNSYHMSFNMDRMDDRQFVASFAKASPRLVKSIANEMERQGLTR